VTLDGEAAREEAPEGQACTASLPGMPPARTTGHRSYPPLQLQIGDRMTDSTGEWQVVGRPYSTAGGKSTHVRVQRADKPGVTETRMWGSYEKVSVKRVTGEEDK
jgi:hypothetical protein